MTRDEIIANNPLGQFLSDCGYELRPAGRNFVTSACPVTQHKKYHRPVTIDTERNLWHCNDCKIGGTVIDWVIHEKNVTAADAIKILGGGENGAAEIIATHDYTDEGGKLLFQCVRYRLKDFRQRQPDGKGGWIWSLKGVRRVLYRLPKLLGDLKRGLPVIIVEGEKDADALAELGFPAAVTCNPLGAGKWRDEYSETLRGATAAFVIADKDKAGREHARHMAVSLYGKTKRVSVIELPDRDEHSITDAFDWLSAGGTVGELAELLDAAPEWTPQNTPQTHSESPEKLFQTVKSFVTRYVVFSRPEHADVITLWIMHTWVADYAEFTPYIYLHSPVMQCGKTQVQRVVEPLVKNPLRTCNVSEAALFREIEESHPTLLWDEIDSVFGNRKSSEGNENKRALINAGYERGLKAIRMERGGGGFVKISFDPFCPKILAGIGRLPDTIVDRSIAILIHRKLRTQPCQKYRRQDRDKAKPLHDALEAWSKDDELLKTLRESQPQMPGSLTDRQEDIWEPLLAIADSIGGDMPKLARAAAKALCDNEDELSYGAEQLAAIRKVIGDKSRITSVELIDGLWEADALPSRFTEDGEPNYKKIGNWLSKFIKSYGGKAARQLKFEGQNLRGYETAELQPIFDRYCPP